MHAMHGAAAVENRMGLKELLDLAGKAKDLDPESEDLRMHSCRFARAFGLDMEALMLQDASRSANTLDLNTRFRNMFQVHKPYFTARVLTGRVKTIYDCSMAGVQMFSVACILRNFVFSFRLFAFLVALGGKPNHTCLLYINTRHTRTH